MAVTIYNTLIGAGREAVVAPELPEVPVLDLSGLDAYLIASHEQQPGTPDPYVGHGQQTIDEWTAYEASGFDNLSRPPKDGVWYYDYAQQAMTAYYYFGMRGTDLNRNDWLSYADAWGNSTRVMLDDPSGRMPGTVYGFSGGLWMLYDAGRITLPEFDTAITNYLTAYNNYGLAGTIVSESTLREVCRVATFLLDYWRVHGFDATYANNVSNTFFGERYHSRLVHAIEGHVDEWLREWIENPQYPENAPYSDEIDYAARAINPANPNGIAIRHLGSFMAAFNAEANIRLYGEDANYQQRRRIENVLEMNEWLYAPAGPTRGAWFDATGEVTDDEEWGSYNWPYRVQCAWQGGGTPHAACSGQDTWRVVTQAEMDESAWMLAELAFAWRRTGDLKYVNRFDQIFDALFNQQKSWAYNTRVNGGKQYNRSLFYLFPGLIMRGGKDELGNDISFKTHWFPDGTYPYNTPPAAPY